MLDLQQFHFRFEALADDRGVRNWNSALHGALIHQLEQDYPDLLDRMYKPTIPASHRAYEWVKDRVPSPFVICPDEYLYHLRTGDEFGFTLTLIGEIMHEIERIKSTIILAMRAGLEDKGSKIPFKFIQATCLKFYDEEVISYSRFEEVSIENTSLIFRCTMPLEIKSQKKLMTTFEFEKVFKAIHRRIAINIAIYGEDNDMPYEPEYIPDIKVWKSSIDQKYIFRKKENTYPINGVMGEVVLKGDFRMIFGMMLFGEFLHIGSNTAFGIGRYELEPIK